MADDMPDAIKSIVYGMIKDGEGWEIGVEKLRSLSGTIDDVACIATKLYALATHEDGLDHIIGVAKTIECDQERRASRNKRKGWPDKHDVGLQVSDQTTPPLASAIPVIVPEPATPKRIEAVSGLSQPTPEPAPKVAPQQSSLPGFDRSNTGRLRDRLAAQFDGQISKQNDAQ